MIAVPQDHKHIFSKNGCWCGAHCCKWYGLKDTPHGPYPGWCDNTAVDGSDFCTQHRVMEIDYND